MKKLIIAASVVCAVSPALAQVRWQTFKPADGGFSVLMPGKPSKSQQGVRASNQRVDVQVFSVRLDNEAYTVSYAAFEKFDNKDSRTVDAIDATVNGLVSNAKGTVVESHGMTVSGNPGRSVKFTMPDGLAGRANVIMAKGRIYQLFVIGTAARVDSADAAKFLGSFRLN